MVSLADIVSHPQKSYGQYCYFQILSTFSYEFGVGCWLVNITWSWAKAIDHICLYLTLIPKSKVN